MNMTKQSLAPPIQFNARQEVILAAGSVGTPQLLMLSGIGNTTELNALGIEPIVDSPGVGRELNDQTYVFFQWAVNTIDTLDTLNRNTTLYNQFLAEYEHNRTGIFANNAFTNQLGFLRLPGNSSILTE